MATNENGIIIKNVAHTWEKLLKLCNRNNVVYRGLSPSGYFTYSAQYSDDWCIEYVPDGSHR